MNAEHPERVSAGAGDLRLPVVDVDPRTGIKRSRSGRWRAYSLSLVHLAMFLHVLHWLWAGTTLTPIEPSEAMETIRHGELNMGFIFFAAALFATLILGRWVCGWGCHLVAYQDLTLWILKRLRRRPKAFRSRALMLVPFAAAAYMFVYPLVVRIWGGRSGHPQPGFTWALSRPGFWDTFPGWLFAILTLLSCGIVIVYFLGPKAFCTYACPYGAFFNLTERFALGRIRVTDACRQCGHCTAVCTSNVDVAAEVLRYGMVVDPGCMKCLDCVEVCPNEALYFGLGKPSILAKSAMPPKTRRWDASLVEELIAAFVFGLSFFSVYGLYGRFPFLMSLGVAILTTYLLMKGLRLFYSPHVLIQKHKLKAGGKITSLGRAYLVGCAVLAAFSIHSAVWRYHDYMGSRAFAASPPETAGWQYDPAFMDRPTPTQRARLRDGLRHLEACGQWGFFADVENNLHLAWLYLFTDERARASEEIHLALAAYPDRPDLWLKLAKVETFLGNLDPAGDAFREAIRLETLERERLTRKAGPMRHPLSSQIRAEWGLFQAKRGDVRSARASIETAVEYDVTSSRARAALADLQVSTGDVESARRTLLDALRAGISSRDLTGRLAALRTYDQNADRAVEDYRAALAEDPDNTVLLHNLAMALTQSRRYREAIGLYEKVLRLAPASLPARADLGAVLFIQQDFPSAIRQYEQILAFSPNQAEAAWRLGIIYRQIGRSEDAIRSFRIVIANGTDVQRRGARSALRELGALNEEDQ